MHYSKRFILFVFVCGIVVHAPRAWSSDIQVSVEPIGGAYRIFNRPSPATEAGTAIPLRLTVKNTANGPQAVTVDLTSQDIFDRSGSWSTKVSINVPAGGAVNQEIGFDAGYGYFTVKAQASSTTESATGWTDFGVVPPPYAGVRPDSFFASNTSEIKRGEDLRLLQAIGMKIMRCHFQPPVKADDRNWIDQPVSGTALPIDFTAQDQQLADAEAHGLWTLPIVGYSFQGAGAVAKSDLARKLDMHGPPRDFSEFVNTWEVILRHYPRIKTYEFWNEPWIFIWTWADTPAEYRRLQTMWCKMALSVDPTYRIVAGNSAMFVRDHIAPYPECWKGLLQGTSNHPYSASVELTNFRAGDSTRLIDDGLLMNRKMGLPFYYLTEGGTSYASPTPLSTDWPTSPQNNIENAQKVVQYYLRSAIVGSYVGNAQWELGYGPAWTKANTAFAVMTHFLEDRPVVADIWPRQELIWGGIFANPRFVTPDVKALPRAQELSSRWNVAIPQDRAGDTTKVAVIWGLTGPANDRIDSQGQMTISPAEGLAAFDMVGHPIPAVNGKLVVPFGSSPVYITTDTLDVVQLRQRVGEGIIEHVTPVNLYALSLLQPADQRQTLSVRLENQMNCQVSGTLSLQIAGQDTATEVTFTADPGALTEIAMPWPGVSLTERNQYAVTLTARVGESTIVKHQLICAARFAKRTIAMNGDVNDWQGVTPVLLDSNALEKGVDLSRYLLNPKLGVATNNPSDKRIVAHIYTAYDDTNIYLAASVNQESFSCSSGRPISRGKPPVLLPYKSGAVDGLEHIADSGDMFMFSFGFRDRVPGWGRQMDDPYAWKGQFYDVDYHYAAHASTDGPKLVRLWGPDTGRQDAYQIDPVPGVGDVPGAKVVIQRDEIKKLTFYELSIPRKELVMFDPSADRLRFGFVLPNSQKLGINGLNWSDACGVFDHWRSGGSFAPSWQQRLPCQTFFGIEH